MNSNKIGLPSFLSLEVNKIGLFYILSFVPLLIIFFYVPFSAVIPFYGFLLFLIKYQKLAEVKEAGFVQKILGVIVVLSSFFAYYGVVLVYPKAAFYGSANYVVYLLGLFLVFFDFRVLREAFAPLFLIVAATSSTFVAVWLKPFLSPFANDFAHIVVNVLRAFGLNASIYYLGRTPIISLVSLSGKMVSGAFVYECIGVYSILVFSIILVVILFEDPSGLKVKLAYSVAGLLGTFVVNVFRVTTIFVTDYFYGADAGATIHYVIGYVLFSAWLAVFLYIYSKRQTLHAKMMSFWKKIH